MSEKRQRPYSTFRYSLHSLMFCMATGCAGSGQLGTGLAPSISGPEVRVDETLPSVLAFSDASVADLWRVLPATFEALGIPGGILDANALIYGNERVRETRVAGEATRDLFRCSAGSGLSLGQYRVEFAITAQPRRVPSGGAELFVQTEAFGRLVTASRSGTTHCVSNGKLEMKIRDQVEIELRRNGS
jgi:hypothetical protein